MRRASAIVLGVALASAAGASSGIIRSSRVLLSAPLTTSGHLGTPSTCGFAWRFQAEADAGWSCTAGAGYVCPPITPGTSPTAEDSPFVPTPGGSARPVLSNVTSAKAPSILAGHAADAGIAALWAGDHTVITMGATEAGGSGEHMSLAHGVYNAAGFYMHHNTGSGNVQCNWHVSGDNSTATVAGQVFGSWSVAACRMSGTTGTAFHNGVAGTAVGQFTPVAPTTRAVVFGDYSLGANAIRGPLAITDIYACALTDAEVTRVSAQWLGALAGSRNISTTRATAAWMEQADGYVYAYSNNAPRIHSTLGLLSYGAQTNYWTNSLDVSAWTDVGTPTDCAAASPTNCNSASGPFSRYQGAAEADTLGDDDGVALEGVESASAGTATGSYVVACYLKSGTSTDYTLSIVTDGTGGGSCTGTDLGGTFARKTCTPTEVGGAPTYVRARILVGDAVGDTGAIIVSQCQLEKASVAGPPVVCGAASCTVNADQHTVSSVGLSGNQGCVRSCVTPLWSTSYPGPTVALLVSGNAGLTARLPDIATADVRSYDGTNLPGLVAPAHTAGVKECYTAEWRRGGSTRFLVRRRDGLTSPIANFAGLSLDSTIGIGSQGANYSVLGYMSDIRLGLDAEACR